MCDTFWLSRFVIRDATGTTVCRKCLGSGLSHFAGTGPYRDGFAVTFGPNLSVPDRLAELSRSADFTALLTERPSGPPGAITPC